jgi:hypothetical protein
VVEKIHAQLTTLIGTGKHTEHEARARCVTARALDIVCPHSIETLRGFATFIDMKPSQYWMMFADVGPWKNQALAFGRQKSPGCHAAMTKALKHYVEDAAFQILQGKMPPRGAGALFERAADHRGDWL